MSKVSKELKRIENKNKSIEQLNQLNETVKTIDKMTSDLYKDAEEYLKLNDNDGFELVANSIFYFQDFKKILQTIKIQFQAYVRTAEFMDTVEGIRPVLKGIAKNMNALPSLSKNNKDFMKFKRSLLRGQINMKAMSSMMTTLNPAVQTTRSKEEMDALKERIIVGMNNNVDIQSSKIPANNDFFNAINKK